VRPRLNAGLNRPHLNWFSLSATMTACHSPSAITALMGIVWTFPVDSTSKSAVAHIPGVWTKFLLSTSISASVIRPCNHLAGEAGGQ
jgi:hypothetical protein